MELREGELLLMELRLLEELLLLGEKEREGLLKLPREELLLPRR